MRDDHGWLCEEDDVGWEHVGTCSGGHPQGGAAATLLLAYLRFSK